MGLNAFPDLPKPIYVDSNAALADMVADLRGEPYLGMDTESNNFYVYRQQICLIQLSSPQTDYLVDTLAIEDMRPLGELTANPNTEIIFHDAGQDIKLLKNDFEIYFYKLFDTMYAARLLRLERPSLAHLLEAYFGVVPDKSYQLADWGQRPIPYELQRYAQMDSHYLIPLRHEFYNSLEHTGDLTEAQEIFDELAQTSPSETNFDPEGYWHFAKGLPPYQVARLRELYLWREEQAQNEDLPPTRILTNEQLTRVTKANPRSVTDMQQRRLLRPDVINAYGEAIISAVERGRKAQDPRRPRNHMPDRALSARYEGLRNWRKKRAQERDLTSDLILSNDSLWELAKRQPRSLDELAATGLLGPWRLEMYGAELLQVIRKYAAQRPPKNPHKKKMLKSKNKDSR